jgi:hypothetical protein
MKFIYLLFFLCLPISITAQDNSMSKHVTPLDNYFSDYKGKYDLILKHFENSNEPLNVKLKSFENELDLLKNDFKAKRTKEYEAVQKSGSKGHSCTKGYSGGTKKCGQKCIADPGSEFYTKQQWISKSSKGALRFTPGTNKVCIYLQKSGKGRVEASVSATFRLKPILILQQVDAESKILFKKIME